MTNNYPSGVSMYDSWFDEEDVECDGRHSECIDALTHATVVLYRDSGPGTATKKIRRYKVCCGGDSPALRLIDEASEPGLWVIERGACDLAALTVYPDARLSLLEDWDGLPDGADEPRVSHVTKKS